MVGLGAVGVADSDGDVAFAGLVALILAQEC